MINKFNASLLRIVLSIALLALMAGGVAGFLFIRTELITKANETAAVTSQAANSQGRLQSLKNAQSALQKNEAVERKVREMVATNLNYTYQDQIVIALKTLGDSAGAKVTNVDFTSTTPLASSTPAAPNAAESAIAGAGDVKMMQASVTLATPLQYDNLMRFLRYIEQNTMAMKVSKISISKASDGPGGQVMVSCDVLSIGVYTR